MNRFRPGKDKHSAALQDAGDGMALQNLIQAAISLLFVISVLSFILIGYLKGDWKLIILILVGFSVVTDLLLYIGSRL